MRTERPLEALLPGETRSKYLDRLERSEAGKTQQLVARIKRGSKYYGQTEPGAWFNVRASNTEPLLRLNVEGPTVEAMEQVRDAALAVIRS